MSELLLKPVFWFHKITERLKLRVVQSRFFPIKLIFLVGLFFVQVFQAVFCLPAYIFCENEIFYDLAKKQRLIDGDFAFRRSFVLTIYLLVALYFGAVFVSQNFFQVTAPAAEVVNYCIKNLRGWDLFFSYYSFLSLAIFVVGITFFVFLMIKLGVFSVKKLPHET
ncbi:hypothetical protein IT413_05540 [Candidatus Peregrinibacteria bacterium]|nr:hypothetical protein [Candidatus Peregrinibacteria bacterium]